jgi:recombination associated protein RdgC
MLKTATIYRLTSATPFAVNLARAAQAAPFAPTGPTQPKSIGWVPPREKNAPLAELIAGQIIMAAMIETRTVPASATDKWVDAAAEAVEKETGRKPGKKQRRELKDQALFELMPQAFPKAVRVPVWIDPAAGLLVLGTASSAQADDVVTLMVQSLGLTMAPIQTKESPPGVMATWLRSGFADAPFLLGTETALKANDESQEAVRYTNADLTTSEVKGHIIDGKAVQSLGLGYMGSVGFALTDGLVLKNIEVDAQSTTGDADAFDADVALTTGALAPMLADLIAALGGEAEPPQ